MIDLTKGSPFDEHEIFSRNVSSLKDTSLDKDHEHYLNQHDDIIVVNFDRLKGCYLKSKRTSGKIQSNDALLLQEDNRLTFVEFKNGRVMEKGKEGGEIRKKIYDSLLILMDILNVSTQYTKKNIDYVLVYNEEKNKEYLDHKSYDQTADRIASFSKRHIIHFGMGYFEGFCLNKVYTYTEQEFEEKFVPTLIKSTT